MVTYLLVRSCFLSAERRATPPSTAPPCSSNTPSKILLARSSKAGKGESKSGTTHTHAHTYHAQTPFGSWKTALWGMACVRHLRLSGFEYGIYVSTDPTALEVFPFSDVDNVRCWKHAALGGDSVLLQVRWLRRQPAASEFVVGRRPAFTTLGDVAHLGVLQRGSPTAASPLYPCWCFLVRQTSRGILESTERFPPPPAAGLCLNGLLTSLGGAGQSLDSMLSAAHLG